MGNVTSIEDLPSHELMAWLRIASQAARVGGEFLAKAAPSHTVVTVEMGHDIKLAADREAEDRILAVLQGETKFDILSEESGIHRGSGPCAVRWIVDPLDGSFNYFARIPLCCVSVALWKDDAPLLGVVFDFNRAELFAGIVGVGAWLNGAPITVSQQAEPGRAVLCTGFPVEMDLSREALALFFEQVRRFKKVRMLGSAALMLAYVAAGRADAYYERSIKLWDVAGGLALVEAAGGQARYTGSFGSDTLTVQATNGRLLSLELQ